MADCKIGPIFLNSIEHLILAGDIGGEKFVDADDVLLHNCVMNKINYIERYPNAKFIISDLIEINENSNLFYYIFVK